MLANEGVGLPAVMACLGLVHGDVGALQQGGGGVGVVGAQGQADAGVNVQGHAFQSKRFGQAIQQALGDSCGAFRVGVGQQDRELIAAKSHQQIVATQVAGQAGADLAQELVPHVMAEGVVDLLEPIQVHDQQGNGPPLISMGQRGVQLAVQQAAVAQSGQVVGEGLTVRPGQQPHLPEGQRSPNHHCQQSPGGEQDGEGGDWLEVGQDQHPDRAEGKQRRDGQHRPALQPHRPIGRLRLPGSKAHQRLRDHPQPIHRCPRLVGPGRHLEQVAGVAGGEHDHAERQ
jgi:hypothetical protein